MSVKAFSTIKGIDQGVVTPKVEMLEKDVFPDIILTATGSVKLLSTRDNFAQIIKGYGISLKKNLISKTIEASTPWSKTKDLNTVLADITSQCNLNAYPKGEIGIFTQAYAEERPFNPVLDWIKSKPWDGVDRFRQVLDLIEVDAGYEQARDIYLKRWCFSAVGLLDNDGTLGCEGVLVFQGEQGLGKTRWIMGLVGEMHTYFKDGLILEPHNKDSVITAVSNWIVEIGELDATFNKSDMAALKGFFTHSKDVYRAPYDRFEISYPRMSVYFASVNERKFLRDATGDRRFWCLPTTKLSLPENYDAQQFWAQIYHMLNAEADGDKTHKWYLSGEEIAIRNKLNESFREDDPVEELILERYVFNEGESLYWTSCTTICKELQLQPTKANTRAVSAVLKSISPKSKRSSKYTLYAMPAPRDSNTGLYLQMHGLKPV